ncbi:unnamed protein product [Closterium sp. Naga37s-1]|nr:unnamed protein product [Closterium sp. Naga37s-1]
MAMELARERTVSACLPSAYRLSYLLLRTIHRHSCASAPSATSPSAPLRLLASPSPSPPLSLPLSAFPARAPVCIPPSAPRAPDAPSRLTSAPTSAIPSILAPSASAFPPHDFPAPPLQSQPQSTFPCRTWPQNYRGSAASVLFSPVRTSSFGIPAARSFTAAADGAAGNAGNHQHSPGVVGMSDDREAALDSVVKVFGVASSPNYWLPWQSKPQREVTGSGFVVSGRRILTSAHVVADHTFVLVRRHGSPKKFLATVEAVAHDCDLALLSVKDPASVGSGEGGINGGGSGDARADSEEFWEGMRALELGDVPLLQESIAVVGYPQASASPWAWCTARLTLLPIHTVPSLTSPFPTHHTTTPCQAVTTSASPWVWCHGWSQYVHSAAHLLAIQIHTSPSSSQHVPPSPMSGGDNISITMGVVSRVEPTQYVHSAAHLLAIQIDAAINPGNSGGPALIMAPAAPAAAPAAAAPPAPAAPDAGGEGVEGGMGEGAGGVEGGWGSGGEAGGGGMGRGVWGEGGVRGSRGAEGAQQLEYRVAGLAFQNLSGAENIGYIVPVPIIRRFLADASLGHRRFPGFASLGVSCQPLENWQLRAHLKMPRGATGVVVNAVQPLSDSSRWLRNDDVLTAFDGVPIANDGSIMFRKRERLPFDYLVSLKPVGETARVSVLRHGQPMDFHIRLNPIPALVPAQQFDISPSYFIFAGLVFVPLTQPYLHEYGPDWFNSSPRRLCERALRDIPSKPSQQIVILSRVLADEVNSGFERLAELQVKRVNGKEVENLRQLRDEVLQCTDGFVRFDLDDDRVIAVSVAAAKKASAQILRRYRVPCASSWDLQQGDAEKGEATVQAGAS